MITSSAVISRHQISIFHHSTCHGLCAGRQENDPSADSRKQKINSKTKLYCWDKSIEKINWGMLETKLETGNMTQRCGLDQEIPVTGETATMEHRNQKTENSNIETKRPEMINNDKTKVQ